MYLKLGLQIQHCTEVLAEGELVGVVWRGLDLNPSECLQRSR